MAAATCYDLLKAIMSPEEGGSLGAFRMDAHEITMLAIGFVVSFLVAWGVVAWFMNWVRNRGFAIFAIYRILFGIAVLLWM
jgi:undecaprenyl-diphosphatase